MFLLDFFRAEVTSDSVTVTETLEQPGTSHVEVMKRSLSKWLQLAMEIYPISQRVVNQWTPPSTHSNSVKILKRFWWYLVAY